MDPNQSNNRRAPRRRGENAQESIFDILIRLFSDASPRYRRHGDPTLDCLLFYNRFLSHVYCTNCLLCYHLYRQHIRCYRQIVTAQGNDVFTYEYVYDEVVLINNQLYSRTGDLLS